MKYIVLIVLALVNFALQAGQRPQEGLLMDAAEYSAFSSAVFLSKDLSSDSSSSAIGAPNLRVDRHVSVNSNFSSALDGEAEPVRLISGFIWIFGSLLVGALAFGLGQLFEQKGRQF